MRNVCGSLPFARVHPRSVAFSGRRHKGGIRELLGAIRDERQSGKTPEELPSKLFGIRQLVKSRSIEFRDEINRLSHAEYMEKPMRQRAHEKFGSESTTDLLKSVEESIDLKAAHIDRLANATTEIEDDFDGFEDFEAIEMDEYSSQTSIRPGDLVEYWPDQGTRKTAVILRLPKESKRYTSISQRGAIDYINSNRFRYIIPGFYDASKIPQEGPLKEGDRIFAPLLSAIKRFKDDVAKFSTDHARELASIYDKLPQRLKSSSSLVSLVDVCNHMYGTVDHIKTYSLFTAMTSDRIHFLPDATLHMSVPLFTTRSLANVTLLQDVRHWTRTRSREYRQFIKTAKEAAKFGSEVELRTSSELMAVHCDVQYSRTDQNFIKFMLNSCLERQDHPEIEIYTTALSSIVKDIGVVRDQVVKRDVVHLALKRIGIISPWDSNLRRSTAIALPNNGSSAEADENERYLQQAFAHNKVQDLSQMGLHDNSEAERHDFGNMPVYTIDGEGALELDDGLSLDGAWIHVHIADPSSFINPNTRIAEIARFRVETNYLGDQLYPMLPSNLIKRHFSLGNAEHGSPTMTTSIRLSDEGEIVEIKIRPGLIHNIKQTTYSTVDELVFGIKPESYTVSELSVNWRPESVEDRLKNRSRSLDPEDKVTLKAMAAKLQRSLQNRIACGLIDSYNTNRTTLLQPPHMPQHILGHSAPIFYAGRPGIYSSVSTSAGSPAISLVSEAALLTNSATAQYAAQRKIPVIYRVQPGISDANARENLLAKRDPFGRVQLQDLLPMIGQLGSTTLSLDPGPAAVLGLPLGYTHATSPLRRYVDMVAQWHIQAFMQKRPYQVNLQELLPHLLRRGKALKQLGKSSSRHWVLQLLQQKMDLGESLDFTATVNANNAQPRHPSEGMLQGVGEKCLIERDLRDPIMPIGGNVQVRVVRLDLMDNNIYVKRIDL